MGTKGVFAAIVSAPSLRQTQMKQNWGRGTDEKKKKLFHSLPCSPLNYTHKKKKKASHKQNAVFLLSDGKQAWSSVKELIQEALHFNPAQWLNQPLSI